MAFFLGPGVWLLLGPGFPGGVGVSLDLLPRWGSRPCRARVSLLGVGLCLRGIGTSLVGSYFLVGACGWWGVSCRVLDPGAFFGGGGCILLGGGRVHGSFSTSQILKINYLFEDFSSTDFCIKTRF